MKRILIALALVLAMTFSTSGQDFTSGDINHTRDVNVIMLGARSYWYYEDSAVLQYTATDTSDTLCDTGFLQVGWETGAEVADNRTFQRYGARNFWLWVLAVPFEGDDSVGLGEVRVEYRLTSSDTLNARMADTLNVFIEEDATDHPMKWQWKYEPFIGVYSEFQFWQVYNMYVPACSSIRITALARDDFTNSFHFYWRVVGIW